MNSITASFYPSKIKSLYNTMKYSQMQALGLKGLLIIPLSANQDTSHRTNLLLLGRKETQKRKNNKKKITPTSPS